VLVNICAQATRTRANTKTNLADELECHPIRHDGRVPVRDVGEGARVDEDRSLLRGLHQGGLYCVLRNADGAKGERGEIVTRRDETWHEMTRHDVTRHDTT